MDELFFDQKVCIKHSGSIQPCAPLTEVKINCILEECLRCCVDEGQNLYKAVIY